VNFIEALAFLKRAFKNPARNETTNIPKTPLSAFSIIALAP
jgi:hypothetical protein